MAIQEKIDRFIERSRLLINGIEIKVHDLFYASRSTNRGQGFNISVEAKILDLPIGNVEFVTLYLDDKIVADGWVVISCDHGRFWNFDEVVSYSPFWAKDLKSKPD